MPTTIDRDAENSYQCDTCQRIPTHPAELEGNAETGWHCDACRVVASSDALHAAAQRQTTSVERGRDAQAIALWLANLTPHRVADAYGFPRDARDDGGYLAGKTAQAMEEPLAWFLSLDEGNMARAAELALAASGRLDS